MTKQRPRKTKGIDAARKLREKYEVDQAHPTSYIPGIEGDEDWQELLNRIK